MNLLDRVAKIEADDVHQGFDLDRAIADLNQRHEASRDFARARFDNVLQELRMVQTMGQLARADRAARFNPLRKIA